jgi:hypothetical protein
MNPQFNVLTHTYNAAFRTGAVTYAITLHHDYDFNALHGLVAGLLTDVRVRIPARTGSPLSGRDRLRYILLGDTSQRSMSAPFASATDVAANDVMDVVEEALEKYGQIDEDTSFVLERVVFSYVIAPPLGGCSPPTDAAAAEASELQARPDAAWYKKHNQSVVRLQNADDMCAARSLVILRARYEHMTLQTLNRATRRRLCNPRSPEHVAAAEALCDDAGLSSDEGVTVFQLQNFGDAMGVLIAVVSFIGRRITSRTDRPAGVAADAMVPTFYLLETCGHFEPIVKMNLFKNSKKWCNTCKKGYANRHACADACSVCKQPGCASIAAFAVEVDGPRSWTECKECCRFFLDSGPGANGKTCIQNHLDSGACTEVWVCRRCDQRLFHHRVTPADHRCSDVWCTSCNAYKNKAHMRNGCYIKKEPLLPPSTKYIFSDIESVQDTGVHEANLVISRDWANARTVHHSASEYVEWILEHGRGQTVVFHNGGGYDLPLIYRYLCTHTSVKCLKPIYNGTKLMLIQIGRGAKAIRFIDSLRWIARPLAKFKETLGLSAEMEKGYFPHWFNTRANAAYSGVVPAATFFKPDRMTREHHEAFVEWHADTVCKTTRGSAEYTGDWVLLDELTRYCDNDVAILREGCMKFRQLFMDISEQKCDPFQYVTIASTCHALYRAEFMPENSIAVLPHFVSSVLRKAMYGGRTNARRLYWEQSHAGQRGYYKDYTSLYPFVQWSQPYPVGHPVLIGNWNQTRGTDTWRFFKRMKASNTAAWEQPELHVSQLRSRYLRDGTLAVLQCDVQCPGDLFHPVLPGRMESGKLVFDLLSKREQWFTSVELRKALDMGYVVTRIHKVALWETTTTALFRPYMAKFLKIKQECSGWPPGCDTAEQRRAYVHEYGREQGVTLDVARICDNPGLRAVAKLCMNSLWGKFSQRPNMTQTSLFHDAAPYLRCVFDDKHEGVSVIPIHAPDGDDNARGIYEVHYKLREGVQRHSDKVNVAIGLFTTAHARVHLYSALEHLDRQVLYYDTDSVIYEFDAHNPTHVHLVEGNYLGDFTDELKGKHIVKFVSGGPKNYGYVLDSPNAVGETEFIKIKGFCLTRGAPMEQLTLATMEQVVRERGSAKRKITMEIPSIVRDKRRKLVMNADKTRSYQYVFDKGEVLDDFTVLPFGHCDVPVPVEDTVMRGSGAGGE